MTPESPDQLLCLTSTWHRRFVEDMVAMVALPIGADWRIRYRPQYVSPSVLKLVENGQGQGTDVTVALARFWTGPRSSSHGLSIHPLRQGTVRRMSRAGELVVIDLRLRGYADCIPECTIESELRANGQTLPTRVGTQPPEGFFCRKVRRIACMKLSDSVGAWEKSATRLLEATTEEQVPFAFGLFPASDDLTEGTLSLEGGTRLDLDVHTQCRATSPSQGLMAPLGEVRVTLQHPNVTLVSSSSVRVDTTRNVKAISLQAGASFRAARGHLAIMGHRFGDSSAPAPSNPATPPNAASKDPECRFEVASLAPEMPEALAGDETGPGAGPAVCQMDRKERCPAFVRIDIPLDAGRKGSLASSLLIGAAIAIGAADVSALSMESQEPWIEVGRLVLMGLLAACALSRGLDLK